jgi:hypothetical protein
MIISDGRLVEGLLAGGEVPDVRVAAELNRDISRCIGDREW